MTPPSTKTNRLPQLPQLIQRKIYKTGQTRGADDDVIFQNRVGRNSTVLIPLASWRACAPRRDGPMYENGFIVLLSPKEYFDNHKITAELAADGLAIGKNALVFYETRHDWVTHNPATMKWAAATSRTNPLGGKYVARIPATTAAADGGRIVRGFDRTAMKGAGIRVYEYASVATIQRCRLQLEGLFWMCGDAIKVVVTNGMTLANAGSRRATVLKECKDAGLLDFAELIRFRVSNRAGQTTCPLCLEELSAQWFFDRMKQAEGRVVPDLTVTAVNLFHVEELKTGCLNHRPYNIGWGHHHCNVVARDSGIAETLKWMRGVLHRNEQQGYRADENNAN